jgi:DNA-directed RNA polymerase subunit RPC12/RpoP
MKLFRRKKEPKAMVCCSCGRKLGEYVKTAEVEDGTDDIYNVCPDCYDKTINKVLEKGNGDVR